MDTTQLSIDPDRERVAQLVRDLLQKNGVPKPDFAKRIEHVLGVSRAQAYKLMNAKADLTFAELRKIANHFQSPLDVLLPTTSISSASVYIPAFLELGGEVLACRFVQGAQIRATTSVEWIAFQQAGRWIVRRSHEAPQDAALFYVERIEIENDLTHAISVAVLDDSAETAVSICANLERAGMRARAFNNAAQLSHALETQSFDCYVLDWLLHDGTSEPLIAHIRETQQATTPIYLLTGEWDTGRADQTAIKTAIGRFGLIPKLKPFDIDLLVSEMYSAIETRGRS